MSLWILRLGIALALVGLALLSSVGDWLSISLWPSLKSLLVTGSLPPEPLVFRVVLVEESTSLEFLLIGVGSALAAASLYARRRK